MPAILVSLLSQILPDVFKRVLPAEKMSEVDQAKLQQEITLALLNQNWQSIEAEYADRNSARQLAQADITKGNAFTSFLAAVVRPMWGLGAFALVAYSVLWHFEISASLKDIINTVLYFYFGGRVVEKIAPAVTAALKK